MKLCLQRVCMSAQCEREVIFFSEIWKYLLHDSVGTCVVFCFRIKTSQIFTWSENTEVLPPLPPGAEVRGGAGWRGVGGVLWCRTHWPGMLDWSCSADGQVLTDSDFCRQDLSFWCFDLRLQPPLCRLSGSLLTLLFALHLHIRYEGRSQNQASGRKQQKRKVRVYVLAIVYVEAEGAAAYDSAALRSITSFLMLFISTGFSSEGDNGEKCEQWCQQIGFVRSSTQVDLQSFSPDKYQSQSDLIFIFSVM